MRQIYSVMREDESAHNEIRRIFLLGRLHNIGTPEAIRAMEDALQHPHERVRLTAVAVLKAYGTPDSLAALQRAAAEETGIFPDRSLADAAREAIEEIQKREQMPKEQ